MIALVLDLANIVGGFLLATVLFRRVPRVSYDLVRANATIAPYAWLIGIMSGRILGSVRETRPSSFGW